MKFSRSTLRDLMIQEALRKHYELKIMDNSSMFYEFKRAIEWYEEEPH